VAAATLAGLLDVAEEVAAAVLGAAVAEEVAVVAEVAAAEEVAVVAASLEADFPSKSSMVCLGLAGLHGLLRWQAWLVYRLQPAFRLPLSWRWIDCPR
jgi:hypothetical protein